jgi:c-di-GMP-binding flagellar brake protein YcgR
MAGYAYDLGPRQSTRIIEQSIRQHATIWAEPIEEMQSRTFSGYFITANPEMIAFNLATTNPEEIAPVIGQYYQLLINLGETRYLAVSDILDVQQQNDGLMLIFSRPKQLQVMQRRHFHRHVPTQSLPVYLSWQEVADENEKEIITTPVLGQIGDISIDGMAVRLPQNLDNHLFIGDTVYARFSLSVRDPEYLASASVSHKEPDRDRGELIIGLQFNDTTENGEFKTRLRNALMQNIVTKKGL